MADRIITLPVNPAFASLNLAQAVVILGYEWFKRAGGQLPFTMPERSPPVSKQQMAAFFADLERELEKVEFFRPEEKRATMLVNLRNIFLRMALSQQDVRTLHGVITSIAHGRKGPARGGVLDGPAAAMLRELIAGKGAAPTEGGPVRGLTKLLRRNPTDAERLMWQALVNDRRFAGRGFKRHVPIGPHIGDFVSLPLKCVIELVPTAENEAGASKRAESHVWFADHGYRVVSAKTDEVENDLAAVLDRLARDLSGL